MKKDLVVIAGATATGKTEVSIELAKKINGEIISADSMLVYKYMNIGTAKPSKEEMSKIKHYMIDEFEPDDEFSIAIFKDKVTKYIDLIHSKNKIPILVGGTGFYINSILYNTDFAKEDINKEYRSYLENILLEKGKEYLYDMLKKVDIESTKKIHINNSKKVIRALEFYEKNNLPISLHNKMEKQKEKYYNSKVFIFNRDREILYNRINMRVDIMIKNGLVLEVEKLLNLGYNKNLVSMQGIGYKEIIQYIEGQYSLQYAIEEIKKNTRNFAKRQITWFKHQSDGMWINLEEYCSNMEVTNKIITELRG